MWHLTVCQGLEDFKWKDLLPSKKRPTDIQKETYLHPKRALKYLKTSSEETYWHPKRDLLTSKKRPTDIQKETYLHSKRALLTSKKSAKVLEDFKWKDLLPSKKSAKVLEDFKWRDLLTSKKRPTSIQKETYLHPKRDLLTSKKSPTVVHDCQNAPNTGRLQVCLRTKRPTYIPKRVLQYCMPARKLLALADFIYSKRTHSIVREHIL